MIRIIALFLLLLPACHTPPQTQKNLLALYKVEPLESPLEERTKLPEGPEDAKGLLKDSPAPYDGILMTERLATMYKLRQAERDKLRKVITIERQAFADRWELITRALADVTERAKRSWWEHNKGLIGFFAGFAIAGAAAVGLTFGVNQASK